jgi:hypothetical protein
MNLETYLGRSSSRSRLENDILLEGKDTHAPDLDYYAG